MVAKPLCPLYKNIIKPLDRARYPELRYINSNEIKYYELNGWGSKEHGNWQSGEYRIEIWYNNKKIAQKQFKIYSSSNSNDYFFDCDTTVAECDTTVAE